MNPQNYNSPSTRMSQDVSAPQTPAPETPAPEAAPERPMGQVIAQQSGPKRGKGKAVLLTLLFLLLLAGIGGVYYWQKGKVADITAAKSAADKQVASLETQLKSAESKATTKTTPAPAATPNYNVVTGNVTTQATGTASVASLYKPTTVDEIWLEYGTTPDKLSTATPHVTQGLTTGDASTYAQQVFKLTGLTAGQNYFYHVAAKSKGTTIYGGTASFTAVKQ